MKRMLLAMASLLCVIAPLIAQAQETKPSTAKSATPKGDTTAVKFFIPGQFKEALKQAKESKRCLLIKAIAFGVDEEGAKCATKGHW
jgi:hypothetical protein